MRQSYDAMESRSVPIKLLIVDDHAATRELIRRYIGDLAFEVRECSSGEEAVDLCAEFTPDVITMDLRMKAMSGLEATQKLLSRAPQTTVIVVTQSDILELRSAALRAGARHIVYKDDLMGLRQFLEQRV
jgi:DNA-binding NarL/FixJ family response regulator